MKKRFLAMFLALAMCLTLAVPALAAANQASFNDVMSTAWYHDAVDYVYRQGIMSGVGHNNFSPNTNLTRAQLCQILYNIEKKPQTENESFSDVSKNAWYSNAVNWAAAQGIVNGTGDRLFSPDNFISREQMVTILYRYATYKNYSLSVPISLDNYSDSDQISSWADEAMRWAVSEGIISGTTATTIMPRGLATRAQTATVLMRFCQRMEAKAEFLAKNVDDFKGEAVINFDDSDETNFAVLEEGTVTSESGPTVNKLISADEDEGVYMFSHVDKTISGLKVGDVLYLTYGDGPDDYVLVKVGAIEINGDTVTITEGQAELSDYFQYIDLDLEIEIDENGTVVASSQRAAVPLVATVQKHRMASRPEGQPAASDLGVVAKDIAGESGFSFNFGYYGESFECTGGMTITVQFKISYDKSIFDISEISYTTKTETTVKAEIGKPGKKDFYKKETPKFTVPIGAGFDAELSAYFKIEGSASVTGSVSATVTTENGVKYSGGKEYPVKECDVDMNADIAGNINIKAGVGITGSIAALKVLRVSLSGEAGIEADGAVEIIHASATASAAKEEKHLCTTCVDGTIDVYFEIDFAVKVGISEDASVQIVDFKPASAKFEFGKFYISYTMAGMKDVIEFGWGTCPHKQYLVTVTVQDENEDRLGGASVWVESNDGDKLKSQGGKTNLNGIFQFYCGNGSYKIAALLENYQRSEDISVVVDGGAVRTAATLSKEEQPNTSTDNPDDFKEEQPNTSTDSSDDFEIVNGVLIKYHGPGGAVIIPDSVTSIGEDAFGFCRWLTSVTIPDSVTSIGYEAFFNCTGLTSVTIPGSVTSIGECAFIGCTGLTSVTLSNGVTSIEDKAFIHCRSLTNVTIPNSVTSIGHSAFWDCTALTSVTIPSSVTNIEYRAFADCTNLTAIQVDVGNATYSSVDGVLFTKDMKTLLAYPCGKKGAYTIPNSVTNIEYYAFSNCTGLTSVTIPNGVTSIRQDVFCGCTGLTSVTIPNRVNDIQNSAFKDCTGLTSVAIPNSVNTIYEYAFSGCTSLKDVYYAGTEAQWEAVSVHLDNDSLTSATIHYNSIGPQ